MKNHKTFRRISLIIGIAILLAVLSWDILELLKNSENLRMKEIDRLIIANISAMPLVVLLLNLWSILKVNEVESNKISSDGCKYCAQSPAGPYLCSHCDSILWYNFKGGGKTGEAVAVFIAHHRWQPLTAFFFLFLFTPLSFMYSVRKEKEAEIARKNEELLSAVSDLNKVRSCLVALEKSTSGNLDDKTYQEMVSGYISFTWKVSDVLRWLCREKKSEKKWKTSFKDTDSLKIDKAKTVFDALKPDYLRNITTYFIQSESAELSQDAFFKKYQDAMLQAQSAPDTLKIKDRKRAALELYVHLKITNTVLFVLATEHINKEKIPGLDAEEAFLKEIFPPKDTSFSFPDSIFYYKPKIKPEEYPAFNYYIPSQEPQRPTRSRILRANH